MARGRQTGRHVRKEIVDEPRAPDPGRCDFRRRPISWNRGRRRLRRPQPSRARRLGALSRRRDRHTRQRMGGLVQRHTRRLPRRAAAGATPRGHPPPATERGNTRLVRRRCRRRRRGLRLRGHGPRPEGAAGDVFAHRRRRTDRVRGAVVAGSPVARGSGGAGGAAPRSAEVLLPFRVHVVDRDHDPHAVVRLSGLVA